MYVLLTCRNEVIFGEPTGGALKKQESPDYSSISAQGSERTHSGCVKKGKNQMVSKMKYAYRGALYRITTGAPAWVLGLEIPCSTSVGTVSAGLLSRVGLGWVGGGDQHWLNGFLCRRVITLRVHKTLLDPFDCNL